ncbi:MAG: hypothetical protein HYX61_10765 [Gammaproteobacteria bacterium]|jgi:hypothetical protein|nr:hypothetical protein [Gammaproteobacteria bacterium]
MSHGGPEKKKEEKRGLGAKLSSLFFRKKDEREDDLITSRHLPADTDLRLPPSSENRGGAVKTSAAVLPPRPQDPLPSAPVDAAQIHSVPSSEILPAASPAKYSMHEEVKRSHKVKKEKKQHRKAESSAHKEKKHHHHHHRRKRPIPQSTVLVASPARQPAPVAAAKPEVLVSYSPKFESPSAASVPTRADLDARAKNVTDQFADLDLQPSDRIQYLLTHDPNAKKAEGIFHRTTAGSQVRESQGTNTDPREGLLPGHPLVVNQQKLEWEPDDSQAQKSKSAEGTSKRPG